MTSTSRPSLHQSRLHHDRRGQRPSEMVDTYHARTPGVVVTGISLLSPQQHTLCISGTDQLDNWTCRYTEIETYTECSNIIIALKGAIRDFYNLHTSPQQKLALQWLPCQVPCADPITSGVCQGSHYSTKC